VGVPKLSFRESLEEKVVLIDKCMACGGCVISCPIKVLEYMGERPKIVGECTTCGICARICPRYVMPWPSLEGFVFGRERRPEEEFGIHRRIVAARTRDENILRVCQDGGVVTTLLIYALKNGIIDGVILSGVGKEKPFFPIPRLAVASEEVLECAGTRYSYSPNLLALQEAIKLKKESIAFVGTPCQIHTIRKMQMFPLKKYVKALNFTIGLMCTEAFTYEGLMEKQIRGALGLYLHEIEKINIKAKVLVTTKSGEVKEIPLKDAKQYTRKTCLPCTDFSAELADISTGGLGLKDWTLTILRTEKGEEIFRGAEKEGLIETKPMEEETGALDLLIKLSKRKRLNAQA